MAERLIPTRSAGTLFEGWQETLIWSALEGTMGGFWALSHKPEAALCEIGDFLFLAGTAQESETRALLEAWRDERKVYRILAARDKDCAALIEIVFAGCAAKGERFAFHKGGEAFDAEKLRRMTDGIPKGISMVRFDEALYHQALQNDWSRDFVSQFDGAQDFLRRGLGFAAVHNGQLIGGASSYTVYSKGIEIQVEVRRDFQRRGIASACCAALILECLKKGLYPSWDAANPASAALAQKLGYRLANAYPVWEIDCTN